MKTKQSIFLILITLVALSLLFPSRAYSQISGADVDRATREVDRSMREEAAKEIIPTPKKPPEIKKEEKKEVPTGPSFFVKEIKLVGCESIPAEEFRPLVENYENKENSLADLENLSKKIEKEYLKRGIIAACFVPPQEIKDDVVTLQIVEARMGALETKDHGHFDKERIAYYWTIKEGDILRYDKISRSLQMMNKNPDREVGATLHAGTKPKTTDVLLTAETKFPIHPFFTYDREGVVSSGKDRLGFGVKDNNFLLVDDILLCGYGLGADYRSFYAYHSVPITPFGTSIMYGFSDSISYPKKQYEIFGLKSRAQNYSFFAYQDLFKKDEYLGEVYIGFDAKDKVVKANTGTINRDRLRILRIGTRLVHKYLGHVTYISPQISQGLNGLGAKRKGFLSSRGAGNTFTKFNLSITHKKPLPRRLQAILKFKAQLASEKLTPQEEFYLGGIDSVRGYPAGDYLADNALQTNVELLIPAFFIPEDLRLPHDKITLKDRITGVAFFDYGYGERRAPLSTEEEHVNYAGIGAGLRIRLMKKAILRLEWGFPIGDKSITESETARFHISLNFEI